MSEPEVDEVVARALDDFKRATIYERILESLRLKDDLFGVPFSTDKELCENIKRAAPEKLISAAEAAAAEAVPSIANECLALYFEQQMSSSACLYSVYSPLIDAAAYNAFACVLQARPPDASTPNDEFLDILDLALSDDFLRENGEYVYPNLTEKFDVTELLSHPESRSKFEQLMQLSMEAENPEFFLHMIDSYAKAYHLSDLKFKIKVKPSSEDTLVEGEEDEFGILRAYYLLRAQARAGNGDGSNEQQHNTPATSSYWNETLVKVIDYLVNIEFQPELASKCNNIGPFSFDDVLGFVFDLALDLENFQTTTVHCRIRKRKQPTRELLIGHFLIKGIESI